MFVNNIFYISSQGGAINFLIWTSSLSSDFFTNQLNFSVLTLESSAFQWLTCFRVSCCFLCFFWMLWMLVIMFKPCHAPHASWITTRGTILTERLFSVSKEGVRSWSHSSLIIYDKAFAKELKAVRPKSCREGAKKKRKEKEIGNCKALCAKAQTGKTRMAIAKFFALNTNATRSRWQLRRLRAKYPP